MYTQVSAGGNHTVLLRSDGCAIACGKNGSQQCSIPSLPDGFSYTQVSAGGNHTVLLRSDGQAVACGLNNDGQCNIPPLDEGMMYIQVSAGKLHTVLLRSDGHAVACGKNADGTIPALEKGLEYTQVSAGAFHSVLLRSDGHVVACGSNGHGQCDIPVLEPGSCYVANAMPFSKDHVLQLDFLPQDDAVVVLCSNLAGQEVLRLNEPKAVLALEMQKRIAYQLKINVKNIRLTLPGGQLLSTLCQRHPAAKVEDLNELSKPPVT